LPPTRRGIGGSTFAASGLPASAFDRGSPGFHPPPCGEGRIPGALALGRSIHQPADAPDHGTPAPIRGAVPATASPSPRPAHWSRSGAAGHHKSAYIMNAAAYFRRANLCFQRRAARCLGAGRHPYWSAADVANDGYGPRSWPPSNTPSPAPTPSGARS
jgi:hypothetical protein